MGRLTVAGWLRLAGVVAGFAVYVCWLGWPSLFPMGEGPDIVHHLTLIHFIQERGTLPHDPLLEAYLGEMNTYPPGSHILAAAISRGLGVDAVHVVHPLIALFVGLKAGLVFAILLRLLRGSASALPVALGGTLLLLVPHAYLLRSFTQYGFYSQVIAETFAIAMVWASLAWHDAPSYRSAALVSLSGVAVVVCWPVFIGAPHSPSSFSRSRSGR